MKKNDKGIALVSLIIVVIVMIVISGVVIFEGIETMKKIEQQSINTNLLLIQAKARTIKEKKEFGEGEYIGEEIEDSDLLEKLNPPEDSTVYLLTENSNIGDINNIKEFGSGKYAIDYENDEVYYIDGIKDKQGNLHYSLTEISEILQEE